MVHHMVWEVTMMVMHVAGVCHGMRAIAVSMAKGLRSRDPSCAVHGPSRRHAHGSGGSSGGGHVVGMVVRVGVRDGGKPSTPHPTGHGLLLAVSFLSFINFAAGADE